jgi:hypothetical protein
MRLLVTGLFITTTLATTFAATRVAPIPRTASQSFRTEGLFEGGTPQPANVESLKLSDNQGTERWELDFSDNIKRQVGKVAPKFQLRYIAGDKVIGESGELIMARPAKFVLTLQNIKKNFLNRATLVDLVKRSKFVKDIVVYPPIENGDTAIELILGDNVEFEPHQPAQKEGRLVLDIKETTL